MPNFNFAKVAPGQDYQPSAGMHNATVDGLKWIEAQRNRVGARRPGPLVDDRDVVLCKNTTGADVDAYSVLGIASAAPIGPADNLGEWQQRRNVTGESPTFASHAGRFVVTLEPIPSNAIGRAAIAGVVPVQVYVGTGDPSTWQYADIDSGGSTSQLQAYPRGAAQILWRESGTGQKWAYVRLGPPASEGWCVAQENWTYDGAYPGTNLRVSVKQCDDADGTNPTGDAFDVLLPRSADRDPNVVTGDVLAYTVAADGSRVATTDYLDGTVGDGKLWLRPAADIPAGWALCDGSSNDSEIELRGYFPRGCDPSAEPSDTEEGAANHDHGGTTGTDGAGTTGSGTASVGDHSDHYHDPHVGTLYYTTGTDEEVSCALRTGGVVDVAGAPLSLTHTDSGHDHSTPDHSHGISADSHDPLNKRVHYIERIDNSYHAP